MQALRSTASAVFVVQGWGCALPEQRIAVTIRGGDDAETAADADSAGNDPLTADELDVGDRATSDSGDPDVGDPSAGDQSEPQPSTPPTIDVVAWGDQPSATVSSVTTGAFSTNVGDELLLGFVAADDVSPGNRVENISGAGLPWQLVLRTNAQRGIAEIWRAFAPAPLTGVSVTATLSQDAASSLTVVAFAGVDTSGTNGSGAIGETGSANSIAGAPSASLITTRPNSWVFGVGCDWDQPIARTLGPNQTLVHQYMPPVGDTYWVQRTRDPIADVGTSVTINVTAPATDRYNLSICEVLPAP